MTLSTPALQMLAQMFGEQSNVQIPVGYAALAVEVREAVRRALAPAPGLGPVNGTGTPLDISAELHDR